MLYTSVDWVLYPVMKLEQEGPKRDNNHMQENWDRKITRYEVFVSTGTEIG